MRRRTNAKLGTCSPALARLILAVVFSGVAIDVSNGAPTKWAAHRIGDVYTTVSNLVGGDILHGGPNPTVALWAGLAPGAVYNYRVFVSSSAPDTITATGSTVDSFASSAVARDTQRINGILCPNALTFASYARQVTASAVGTIEIGILSLGTPTPSGYAVQRVGPAVPEPSTASLLGLSLLGAGFLARRRKR